MPPSTKFSKTDIINAALELIQEKGGNHFSVRNVAQILQSSPQPIYSNFKDVDELFDATLAEIKRRLIAYMQIAYTDKVFRNMGLGFTFFARDFPRLFSIFLEEGEQNQIFIDAFLKDLRTDLDLDQRFDSLSGEEKDTLLERMWIFTYGYANLIVKGIIKEISNNEIEKMVVEVGTIMIKNALVGGK